jgi:hypothetical protein
VTSGGWRNKHSPALSLSNWQGADPPTRSARVHEESHHSPANKASGFGAEGFEL